MVLEVKPTEYHVDLGTEREQGRPNEAEGKASRHLHNRRPRSIKQGIRRASRLRFSQIMDPEEQWFRLPVHIQAQ